jgi:hypothetical protein
MASAFRITIDGHPYIVTDEDGTANIRGEREPRHLRGRNMTATHEHAVVTEHRGDSGAGPVNVEHKGTQHLELSVEMVEV